MRVEVYAGAEMASQVPARKARAPNRLDLLGEREGSLFPRINLYLPWSGGNGVPRLGRF